MYCRYIHICMCTFKCSLYYGTRVCVCVCVCVYIYICIMYCRCIHICMCAFKCSLYYGTRVCVYVYVYVWMCVCVCSHTHTFTHSHILRVIQAPFTCFPSFLPQIIIFCLLLPIHLHIRFARICFVLFSKSVSVDMLTDMNTTAALLTYQLNYKQFCYFSVLNQILWFIPFTFQVRPQ